MHSGGNRWRGWKARLASVVVIVLLLVPMLAYASFVHYLLPEPVRPGSDFAGTGDTGAAVGENPPSSPAGSPGAPTERGRVVMVLMTAVTWDQFYGALASGDMPAMKALVDEGATGLMNTNTAMYRRANDAYVTIGAGTRARDASGAVGEADAATQVAAVYRRRMGVGPGRAQVLQLGVAALRRANAEVDHAVTPGALGQALHDAGLETAVFGNADVPGQPNRGVVATAMDSSGRVQLGRVGRDVLVTDDTTPGGFRTSWSTLWSGYQALPFHDGFVVIEAGDFYRLDQLTPMLSPTRLSQNRQLAFQRLDAFVGRLLTVIDPNQDLLVIASIAPDTVGERIQDALTPVVVFGRGITQGLLVSDTTRRPGIIANVDIAPTVLAHYGLAPTADMVGSPLQRVSAGVSTLAIGPFGGFYRDGGVLQTLDDRHAYTLYNNQRRWPYLLKPYILLYLAALILSVVALFRPALFTYTSTLLVGLMLIPLVLFLVPMVSLSSGLLTAVVSLVAVGILTAGLELLKRVNVLAPLVVTGFVTASLVTTDVYLGGQLMVSSPLGYSPIVGARYYGIGNEYMGVLLGAALVGLCALADALVLHLGPQPAVSVAPDVTPGRQERADVFPTYVANALLVAGLGCAFYVVMSPRLGANLGGTISAAAGFSIVLLRARHQPIGLKELAVAGVAAAAAVVGLGMWDMSRPVQYQTHIGHAFSDLTSGGLGDLLAIARRKLDMNLRLFRVTMWSRVLVGSVAVFVALVYRPVGIFARVASRYPYLTAGLHGIATLTMVAFVVNDSGVVFGALSMVYGASALIYLVAAQVLPENRTQKEP